MSADRYGHGSSAAEVGAHKFFAPPEFKGAVRRAAILERIFDEPGLHAVLIQGPAGHGKTTLLQQVKSDSEQRGVLTGWLTFDEADNDPRRFFLHLQALIASTRATTKLPELPEIDDSGGVGLLRPVDWFVNGLLESGAAVSLFFDEFQHLNDKTILGFFRDVLERLPENVRIFIGSRTVPEVGFARLVVNNQALLFRTDELRFSLAEAAQFFSSMRDIIIRSDEVEVIYSQTEGWPAALQLFRLALVSPSMRISLSDLRTFRPPELAEYLADYVLALQTPGIQDFLRRISPLTRLSAALCDAVTGRGDSQETLMFLQRSGLFVRSLDSDRQWFRLHSLFSVFLQEQLRQSSEEALLDVHRRAGRWYQDQGLHEEAIYHWVAAREYSQAGEIMDAGASELIEKGHLMTVERWYERLPFEEVEKRPQLAVKIAWALTFLRRQQKLLPVLRVLERCRDARPAATNPQIVLAMSAILVDDLPRSLATIGTVVVDSCERDAFTAFEFGAAANLQGYFWQAGGDFERARECQALARALSDRADSGFCLGYAHANAGTALIQQGKLREALDCFRAGAADPRIRIDESIAGASLVSCYVQALYEANDIDAAENLFNEFHEVIAQATLLDYLAVAYVSMSRIDDLRGRPERGSALLDEAENIGFANSLPRLVRIVNWERIRRLIHRGDIEQARLLASRLAPAGEGSELPENWIPFAEDSEGVSIGQARLAIFSGQPAVALRLIASESGLAQKSGRVRRQIRLLVLEALAHAKKGDAANAHRALREALQLAGSRGFVRILLDEGEPVIELLQQEYEVQRASAVGSMAGPQCDQIRDLLHASGIELQKAEAAKQFSPLEPLTKRENDILALLASGVSNKEIARRLFVSENTVKFHLKNAYSKLGVTSRLQAITAARKMALI
jgi:LuxR family maltose regulon positive regulatory protein